jgi:flavorubredoxin
MRLKDGVHWVGVKNPELRVFDIIMTTEKGTTYNSYLIDDDKTAVIDTVKMGYFKSYLDNLHEVIGDRKVDYIIINHTELDHSGSLRELLQEYPDAVVYASRPACNYLKKIVNMDFKCHAVSDGEELTLGKKSLKFIIAPFLHWPDTMFTYDKTDNILFTCDVFGSHFCGEGMFNDNAGDFMAEMKYYFDVIMGPFKKYVLQAIDKIEGLPVDMICTSHGPIHRSSPGQYIDLYRKWSSDAYHAHVGKYVLVLYVSAYGNTKFMGELIKEQIEKTGIKADIFDISQESIDKLAKAVDDSDAVLIGSPTINQDAVKPVWDLLSLISPIANRGKTAGAFGSYGWSGEAVGMINERLKGLKFKVVEPGVRINFVPSEEDIKAVAEFAGRVAEITLQGGR